MPDDDLVIRIPRANIVRAKDTSAAPGMGAGYGGSVAEKPKRLLRYTKADRDTILAKYRTLQVIHAEEHARVKALEALLGEALPNLADYAIMAADRQGSLWGRIHAALSESKERRPAKSSPRKTAAPKAGQPEIGTADNEV